MFNMTSESQRHSCGYATNGHTFRTDHTQLLNYANQVNKYFGLGVT